jgi:hypothetical protein
MARAKVYAGACGFTTHIVASRDGNECALAIESECQAIQRLAAELKTVEPFHEISSRRGTPKSLEMGAKYCTHAACPVPTAIIKAVEIEAGLNLPVDVHIQLSKD